jgi:hypothetical protein
LELSKIQFAFAQSKLESPKINFLLPKVNWNHGKDNWICPKEIGIAKKQIDLASSPNGVMLF